MPSNAPPPPAQGTGQRGEIANVCRVFNDDKGVELVQRTGLNPSYSYLQLGCSRQAECAMLAYARSCVGKPFSNVGMARSVIMPRTTTGESFFCAELVASILQKGGLLAADANPGAATPENLHRMYRTRAAAAANPYLLRELSFASGRHRVADQSDPAEREALLPPRIAAPWAGGAYEPRSGHMQGVLRVVADRRGDFPREAPSTGLRLSLRSLDMRAQSRQ